MRQSILQTVFYRAHRFLIVLVAAMIGIVLPMSSALPDDGFTGQSESYLLESPSTWYMMADACPRQDMTLFFAMNIEQPGVIFDTVGINSATTGDWTLRLDRDGTLGFAVYAPGTQSRFAVGNGWLQYQLADRLSLNTDYWIHLEIENGMLFMMAIDDLDNQFYIYEEQPVALHDVPVYVGDFPMDDSWGSGYNIHPAARGVLVVFYFGPYAEDFEQSMHLSYLIPGSGLGADTAGDTGSPGGDIYTTTVDDTADWGQPVNGDPFTGDEPDQPFTLDYPSTEATRGYYEASDCLEAQLSASPLYAGAAPLPGGQLAGYEQLRRAKVSQIISEADSLFNASTTLAPRLEELSGHYLNYLAACLQVEPGLDGFAEYTGRAIIESNAQRATALDNYRQIPADTGDAYADSYLRYLRVVSATRLASLSLQAVDDLSLYGALLADEMESRAGPASQRFEQNMALFDDLAPELENIANQLESVGYGLRQLESADYYLAQATLEFIDGQIAEVEAQAQLMAPRPGVSAGDIAQARNGLKYVQAMRAVLAEGLAGYDTSNLIALDHYQGEPLAGSQGILPDVLKAICGLFGPTPVYAAGGQSNYGWSKYSLNGGINVFSTHGRRVEHRSTSWKDVRKMLRGGQKVIGFGVDTVGATVSSIARPFTGWYYGNTAGETWEDIKGNYKQVLKNWREDKSGTGTYRTAKGYMEGAEDMAQDGAKDFIKKTLGGNFAPWAAGKLAKGLVSTFTGLAKGIYAVADPTSTDGELAVGILEIGLAIIAGNSKAYEGSLAGIKQALIDATAFGNVKDLLKNVLNGYRDDLIKQGVGDATDGKSLVESLLGFLGIPAEALEEYTDDGNYVGEILGQADGEIYFTILGTTWQGSIKGSIPWVMEGTELSGVLSFRGTLTGSFDPKTGQLSGEVNGTTGSGESAQRFSGSIGGKLIRGAASGTWSGSDTNDALNGRWEANKH